MNATNHWARKVPCETCHLLFKSESAAEQHMKATGHYKKYCKSCDRKFDNENNLRMHLNSKIHRGRDVVCPFCSVGFTTASGLSHHLETRACPNADLTRETIYRTVCEPDTQGVITYKQIGWIEDQNAQYTAMPRSWNGYRFECYLCHREFTKLSGLNQHLNSSVHMQHVYHCPNTRCKKTFAALAGLFNHLESESCSFIRFARVQESIGAVFGSGRRIEF
ncbi:uncharacterized protein BDV17DRAFT_294748 [Aspergillus undulatus]|uniref:uncharacterized protein n=1 Tax=Aspergillus undulatus TaxID=1810928 RepID=UPI003CCD1B5B